MVDIKSIKTGVIGVGSMGRHHARVYSEISNLVAISDPNKEQGLQISKKHNVPWYENYEEILDKVDAVSISVPTFLHKEIACKVANAKVNILVEKPLAISKEDSQEIISVAKNNNVVLAVGHIERHNPVFTTLKSILEDGESRDILTLTARRYSTYPARINDVGVLFDLTIHDVEIINELANSKAISVYVLGGNSKNKKYEDYINLMINYQNGIIGICQTSWVSPIKIREFTISTSKELIYLDLLGKTVEVSKSHLSDNNSSETESLLVSDVEPLKSELIDFLESVKTKRVPLVSGEDGLNAVTIVQAGFESLKSNRVIIL